MAQVGQNISLLEVRDRAKQALTNCNLTKVPDQDFKEIVALICAHDNEEGADLLAWLLGLVNRKRNIHYINSILHIAENFIRRWMFFLLSEINFSLEIYLSVNNIRQVFKLLEITAGYCDAQTLSIIANFKNSCNDKRIIKILTNYESRGQERIDACFKRIEYMEVDPIITCYHQWQ